ncbi:MAG TPA: YggT family protein [Actinomycetes bacterium]
MSIVGQILGVLLLFFLIFLIARLVFDYIQMFARSWRPTGVVLVLAEIIYTVTDPPLRALRKVIPPLKIGSISLDLSFLVLIILVTVAQRLVAQL